ncbi:MAG: tetratricopeptide repeat protein [Bacteroidetes bacterium]|nr:tetratricopeptide repeat protein [Bacteroidota bacterium]MBK9415638.1 tetratricopeptide repeat protein [Bacteroidota bacterium]MBP6657092.1 tetratricopeptide repeat protein [Bacteroidia bacterium]
MKKTIIYFSLIILGALNASAQSIQEARKLTENEQYEESSAMYKQLISAKPTDANLYYFFGDNLLSDENADSARIVFEKGKTIDPNNALLKIGTAKLLMDAINVREAKASLAKDGNNPELKNRNEDAVANVAAAVKLLDEAVATAPAKDPLILIEAAEAYIHYENKDLDKAKLLLDKANAIDPKNVEVNILYGEIYGNLSNATLAAEYFNKAQELDPKSARAIVSKGRLYYNSTNYDAAAEEFERAIKLDSAYAPAYSAVAYAYLKQGKLAKAKEAAKKYLDLSKNNCSARIFYASLLYASKSYQEALDELALVSQRCDSNNIKMLRIQAYSNYEADKYPEGIAVMEHLFRIVPADKRIIQDFEFYGKLLIKTDKDSLGIEQLLKAYALDPTRADLLSEISNAWFKLKNYPNAILYMQQKITLGKDIKVADYYLLGRANYFIGQYHSADSAFMKVNEITPTYAGGWLWRADVSSNIDSTGKDSLAKPFYDKYIQIADSDSVNISKYQSGLIRAYSYMASYYLLIRKDNERAKFYLRKKLDLIAEPEEKKKIQIQIDQIDGKLPKGK